MGAPHIRAIGPDDYDGWLALWNANNQGQTNRAVTAETWRRLNDPTSPVNGLIAEKNGHMAGLVHYILHPVTGHIEPACYMQDVYVDLSSRRMGIGRALVTHLAHLGKNEGWARLYWLAEADNDAAQTLYRTLGLRLNFTFHVLPL